VIIYHLAMNLEKDNHVASDSCAVYQAIHSIAGLGHQSQIMLVNEEPNVELLVDRAAAGLAGGSA